MRSTDLVRRSIPNNIHLADENSAADDHCHSDNRNVGSCKVQAPDENLLSREDIPPQEACERRAERDAKCTIVNPERHTVHRRPEGAVRNGDPVQPMNFLPCLDDAT